VNIFDSSDDEAAQEEAASTAKPSKPAEKLPPIEMIGYERVNDGTTERCGDAGVGRLLQTGKKYRAVRGSSEVLSAGEAEELRSALPFMYSTRPQWHCVYHLRRDGTSISTLYNRVEQSESHVLLVVKTTTGARLGAFITTLGRGSPLQLLGNGKYAGTGGTFVFRIRESKPAMEPPGEEPLGGEAGEEAGASVTLGEEAPGGEEEGAGPSVAPEEEEKAQQQQRVEIHKSTGKNDYFVLTERKSLHVGGGGGGAALNILNDSKTDLYHGSSYPSATFGNPEGMLLTTAYMSISGNNHSFDRALGTRKGSSRGPPRLRSTIWRLGRCPARASSPKRCWTRTGRCRSGIGPL